MSRPNKIKAEESVDFKTMLRIVFPNKRPEERPRFYRLYLRDHIRPNSTIPASEVEIEEQYKKDESSKFCENEYFHKKLWAANSAEKWKNENFSKRASKMAKASWSEPARNVRKKIKSSP